MPERQRKLTDKQRVALNMIAAQTEPPTTCQLAKHVEALGRDAHSTWIGAQATLRRLEGRALVARVGQSKPMRWHLTEAGRRALACGTSGPLVDAHGTEPTTSEPVWPGSDAARAAS